MIMFLDKTIEGVLFVQGTEITFQIEPNGDGSSIVENPSGESVAHFASAIEAEEAYDCMYLGYTIFDFKARLKEIKSNGG